MATLRTTRIFPDTIRQDTCQARACGKTIYFAQNVRTLNFSPYDTRPVPLAEEQEIETRRRIWLLDMAVNVNHFVTCVARQRFGRRAR